jgi:hypothetical protein
LFGRWFWILTDGVHLSLCKKKNIPHYQSHTLEGTPCACALFLQINFVREKTKFKPRGRRESTFYNSKYPLKGTGVNFVRVLHCIFYVNIGDAGSKSRTSQQFTHKFGGFPQQSRSCADPTGLIMCNFPWATPLLLPLLTLYAYPTFYWRPLHKLLTEFRETQRLQGEHLSSLTSHWATPLLLQLTLYSYTTFHWSPSYKLLTEFRETQRLQGEHLSSLISYVAAIYWLQWPRDGSSSYSPG